MLILRKHWAFQAGYDIKTDMRYGFQLWFGHKHGTPPYRTCISFFFDWPRLVYEDEDWVMNKPDFLRGIPFYRPGIRSSRWTGRRQQITDWSWPHTPLKIEHYD